MTCPVCGSPDEVRPVPWPHAGSANPRPMLARRAWPWLAGLAGLLLCCCGVPYLTTSVLTGSIRSLITLPVLGMFLALTVVDKIITEDAETSGMPARWAWHCWRCGHTWPAGAPLPVPPAKARSRRSVAALRTASIARMVVLPWKPAGFLFAPRHRLAPED